MSGASGGGERDLLASVPGGGLLRQVLRLLVSADRREEFVGDLVEQAHEQLAGQGPSEIGRWLWCETLRSAPSLLAAHLRRLARRAAGLAGPGVDGRGVPIPIGSSLLMGARYEQRSWSVPMAISVSVHAVTLFALLFVTTARLEELDAPWVPVAIKRAFASMRPVIPAAVTPEPARAEPPKRHRRPRPAPVVAAATVMAAEPSPPALEEIPIEDPVERKVVVVLPPPVAEKRCLSCPPPRLPPALARLGAEQQVLVKTCVGSDGGVTSVDVLRGLGASADADVVNTVRGWRFSPHAVGDHPVPFCYPTRFVFTMN